MKKKFFAFTLAVCLISNFNIIINGAKSISKTNINLNSPVIVNDYGPTDPW